MNNLRHRHRLVTHIAEAKVKPKVPTITTQRQCTCADGKTTHGFLEDILIFNCSVIEIICIRVRCAIWYFMHLTIMRPGYTSKVAYTFTLKFLLFWIHYKPLVAFVCNNITLLGKFKLSLIN